MTMICPKCKEDLRWKSDDDSRDMLTMFYECDICKVFVEITEQWDTEEK